MVGLGWCGVVGLGWWSSGESAVFCFCVFLLLFSKGSVGSVCVQKVAENSDIAEAANSLALEALKLDQNHLLPMVQKTKKTGPTGESSISSREFRGKDISRKKERKSLGDAVRKLFKLGGLKLLSFQDTRTKQKKGVHVSLSEAGMGKLMESYGIFLVATWTFPLNLFEAAEKAKI